MFIYILSTGTMNTSCVDAKLHSLGWKFEDLTYNYTSNNLSDCSYKNMIKTPSDEYFRCEQWNKASGFLNLNVNATAYFFMHGFLFFQFATVMEKPAWSVQDGRSRSRDTYRGLWNNRFFCVCSNFVLGLDKADGIGGIGDLSPKLVAVLLLAWLIVFFALKKGVKSSGKVRLVFCNTCARPKYAHL